MSALPPTPLPPLLEDALQRVCRAARAAAERTVESLGLAALGAINALQRDAVLAAQFELNRKVATFSQAFDAALRAQARREHDAHRPNKAGPTQTPWEELSLVENRELEIQVQAERFGLEIGHACEWELRELDAYMGSVLDATRTEHERNPVRPEAIGHALIRAVTSASERPEVRRVLEAELTRSLATMLGATYGEIVAAMRRAGVKPVSLSVRMTESRGEGAHSRSGSLDPTPVDRPGSSVHGSIGGGPPASRTGDLGTSSGHGRWGSGGRAAADSRGSAAGTPIGQVDPGMMALLRRLATVEPPAADGTPSGWSAGTATDAGAGGLLPNVIHANRDQLRQASRGALDHMVIDVIGSLFDQILSDPKVPPQLARQIARLQLPVLRAALGDPSFFASRRHPVRQFINRIASLANGFDDFDDDQGQAFLARVRELVQEIVNGDFDQIETYETRLASLEASVAELARAALDARAAGATAMLQQREEALRLGQHYAQRLDEDLQPLAAPAFVREFVSRVWSRVILTAAERDGVTSESVRELRRVGRELFMSVQPKASPAQRKSFLAELPKLMRAINDGLNSIGWPEDRRRAFFGQLMPAHAEALRAQGGRVLDFNMLSRQVEHVLERGLPSASDLPAAATDRPLDELPPATFSADEATRIGLVDEGTVDWHGKVDIDLAAEPEVRAVDLELPGLPAPTEPIEPVSGPTLADHVQIGFSYQMHLEGDWHKVRLAHVSAGRSFYVFTRGGRHQRTVSLTHRMLVRLCETGRMRAFESAQLLERATARTRRQLSAMAAPH